MWLTPLPDVAILHNLKTPTHAAVFRSTGSNACDMQSRVAPHSVIGLLIDDPIEYCEAARRKPGCRCSMLSVSKKDSRSSRDQLPAGLKSGSWSPMRERSKLRSRFESP